MNNVIGNVAGRLPVYCGEWSSNYNGGNGYFEYNEVSYAGSLFINTVDGNRNIPCTLVRDSSDNLIEYHLQQGWHFAANAMDASIDSTREIRKCERIITEYQDDVNQLVDDVSTLIVDVEDLQKYATSFTYIYH